MTALWLLPFYPSPLRDDGYDIADYATSTPPTARCAISARSCARRTAADLRVITELVLNHTSDQHPWFQRARRAPAGSRWSATSTSGATPPDRYQDARIIFKDFETSNWTWDPVAGAYYWHRFYSPPARPELRQPARSSAPCCACSTSGSSMGVDGLRLDAVPYLFEREGTNCENLPETHEFLRKSARPRRRALPRPHAAGRGQPVARGRRRLLRRGRRVPHGVPLPAHAADVHGAADGGPLPDHGHPPADAGDPGRAASGRCSCATTTS